MSELAQHFGRLFTGLELTYGKYEINPQGTTTTGQKVQGKAVTHRGRITVAMWDAHLSPSGFGLGVTPARQDGTCRFGAIDVDRYFSDLHKLNSHIQSLGLPLVLCRTKSGGAHLYLFGAEDLPCRLVRERLLSWAIALGEGKQPLPNGQQRDIEIFPKQDRINPDNDDDCGSWINIPYQGGQHSTRYALSSTNASLTPEQFVVYADSMSITVADLERLEISLPSESDETDALYGAPPCLVTLTRQGFPEGTRNNGLFNIGIYLKKRFPEDWDTRLPAYNSAYMEPALEALDLKNIIKSLAKKEYTYKCKDQPICGACDRKVCQTREFGISKGRDNMGFSLDRLEKVPTTPPIWIGVVGGIRLKMETVEIMDYRRFQTVCINELNQWPPSLKPGVWVKMITELLENVTILPAPPDATSDGQLLVYLQRFCTSKTQARNKDEILLGKPFTDEVSGRTLFCVTDFLQYLQQQRVVGVNEKRLYVWLLERGDITYHQEVLKGKLIQYWSIAQFTAQTEDFIVPRLEQEAPF